MKNKIIKKFINATLILFTFLSLSCTKLKITIDQKRIPINIDENTQHNNTISLNAISYEIIPNITSQEWQKIKANENFKAKLILKNNININLKIMPQLTHKNIFYITKATNLSSLETACDDNIELEPQKSCVWDIWVKPNGKTGNFKEELTLNITSTNSTESIAIKINLSALIKGGIINPLYGQNGFAYGFVTNSNNQLATRITIHTGIISLDNGWIIGGNTRFTEGTNDQEDFLLYKFDHKGNIFTSFGTNGFVVQNLGTAADKIWDLDLLSNGDIAAAAYKVGSNWKFIATIFNKDGQYLGNPTTIAYNQRNFAVTTDPNDKIILGGRNELSQQILLRKINTDFTIDTSFGTSGLVNNPIGLTDYNFIYSLRTQKFSDNTYKIIGAGWIRNNTTANSDLLIFRLNSDGNLDTSFGTNGYFRYDIALTDNQQPSPNYIKNEQLEDMLILDSNEIVATGITINEESKWKGLILKLSENGILDTTFGEQSGFSFLFIDNNKTYAKSIAKQKDNKFVITGTVYPEAPEYSYCFVARYKENGKIDLDFGQNGIITIKSNEGNIKCFKIGIHQDESIVIAAQGIKDSKPAVISIGIIP